MANVRVNPNLEAEVTGHTLGTRAETHGQMERALGAAAEDIARRARQIARSEYYRFGGYTRSIEAESGVDEHGELVGRVVATDWKAHWAERPPRQEHGRRRGHILARAARQVGFRVLAGQTLGLAGAIGGGVARRALGGSTGRGALTGSRRAITGR
jgi:hypothetical protein